MTLLLSTLLTLLVTYGYITLAIVVFLSAVGLPLPATALILASGSFTIDGTLSFWIIVGIVSVVATVGDLLAYSIARRFGVRVSGMIGRFGITHQHLVEVDHYLDRWGALYIFASRWLITPLCTPVNIAAGLRRYSRPKFILYVFTGEFVWALLYAYLGRMFGVSWSSLVVYLNGAPEALSFLAIGILTAVVAWRMWKRQNRKPYAKST